MMVFPVSDSTENDDVAVAYLNLRNGVEKALTRLSSLREELRQDDLPLIASDVLQILIGLREALET